MRAVAAVVIALALVRTARAEGPQPFDQLPAVSSRGPLSVDGGLVLALPATWQTGLSTGVGAGVAYGRTFALGVRASWSTSTESSLAWTVSHDDYRLRVTGAVQRAAGRGVFALRLGLGPTMVYEDRVRNQGARAGLTGSALETTALAAMPAGELEAVVTVHVGGPWLMLMSGGPSLLVSDGAWHSGWGTLLSVGWQP
ncbi:MAG TPA: hypothetical protein VH560_15220 [Polyangia bacterium]|jgi:hypothetical protein|nr:hypothetical protein [Polyangia bacterium]